MSARYQSTAAVSDIWNRFVIIHSSNNFIVFLFFIHMDFTFKLKLTDNNKGKHDFILLCV